ncbi:MAG: TolC family protein [Cyanobacteriota bacterium]
MKKRINYFITNFLFVLLSLFIISGITLAEDINVDSNTKSTMNLSLQECINIAMDNSPIILQAKEDVEVARAKLAEARSGYMPQVNARASYNYFNTNQIIKTKLSDDLVETLSANAVMEGLRDRAVVSGINGINPFTGQAITELDVLAQLAASRRMTSVQMYSALKDNAAGQMRATGKDILWTPLHGNNLFKFELHAFQPIFLSGKVYNLNKQAKAGIGASRQELEQIKHEVIFEVTDRYQKVLLAKDGLELARDTERKFATLRDLIEALYKGEAENVTKLDYLEVEAYLGLIRGKVYEVEKSLELSKAALRQSMGYDDTVDIEVVEDTQSYDFIDVNLEDSIQQAMLNRPEFSKLEYGIKAKKHEIKVEWAEYLPKIVLDSAFEVFADNKNYLEPDPVDFRLSVIADVPLFDGLRAVSRVNQRKHELEKLKQLRKQLKNGVTLEVINAVLTLIETKKKVIAADEAVKSAVENQSLARQSFELEIVESKKVVDAQVLEAKVKTELLMAIYNYNVAKASLKKAVGLMNSSISAVETFEIEEIKDNNNFVDPSENNNFLIEKPETIM